MLNTEHCGYCILGDHSVALKYSQQRQLPGRPAQHPPGQKAPLGSAWSLHWVPPLAVH